MLLHSSSGALAALVSGGVMVAGCHLSHELERGPHGDPHQVDAGVPGADAGEPRDATTICSPWTLRVEPVSPDAVADVTAMPIAFRSGHETTVAFVTHGALTNAGEGDVALDPTRCASAGDATTCAPDMPSSWDGAGMLRLWARDRVLTLPLDDAEIAATGTLASADLDANHKPELVAFGRFSGAIALDHEGHVRWRADLPSLDEVRMLDVPLPEGRPRSLSGTPLVVDLEGDGEVEVALGYGLVEGRTGEVRWRASGHRGINRVYGPMPCAGDLDGDGVLEIVAGGTAYRADGSVLWQAAVSDGFCAIGETAIALVSEGRLFLLDREDGAVRWTTMLAGGLRMGATGPAGGPPTLVDVDGDGDDEILVASESRLALYDPRCHDPSCTIDGWSIAIEDGLSGVTGVTVVDVDGDLALEVLHADQTTLRLLDARTGAVRVSTPRLSRTRTERPLFVDVDGDGSGEILVGISSEWDGNHDRRDEGPSAGLAVVGPVCARWATPPGSSPGRLIGPD
ncbi:PQQ-binding-like beta-propeller repeat protein [Sandaracinus amylolyticus]|nr:PQQ-binding-like beta-propeller repeat protein [Sandaracinus amylolyticus]